MPSAPTRGVRRLGLTALGAGLVVASAVLLVGPGEPAPARPADAGSGLRADVDSSHGPARTKRFPTRRTAGVPRGWQPKRTITGTDLVVRRAGAVVEDVRLVDADLIIDAPDVTVRRVELQGGVINNFAASTCSGGLKLKHVSVVRAPGEVTEGDEPVIGQGGYTAKKVAIVGLPEGFRVGGGGECGPVKIVSSWVLVQSPDICDDWHGDGLQGYGGDALTIKRVVLKMRMTEDCGGTAPFFYPADQGNTSVSIDGLIVDGGGYPFRLGTPGTVQGLHIVAGSWVFGPIDVKCSVLSSWDADIATVKGGQPHAVRTQKCSTEQGY